MQTARWRKLGKSGISGWSSSGRRLHEESPCPASHRCDLATRCLSLLLPSSMGRGCVRCAIVVRRPQGCAVKVPKMGGRRTPSSVREVSIQALLGLGGAIFSRVSTRMSLHVALRVITINAVLCSPVGVAVTLGAPYGRSCVMGWAMICGSAPLVGRGTKRLIASQLEIVI